MTAQSASQKLSAQIRQLMKKHKATYGKLATALDVSESTAKRLVHSDDLSFSRLEQLATFFELNVFDLIDLARDSRTVGAELTEEQEGFLAAHGNVAHYFWLLMHGWSPSDIARKKNLSEVVTERYLSTLESLALIRRQGKTGVVCKYVWPLSFRFDGPLQKKFSEPVFSLFLRHLFERVKGLGKKPREVDFTIKMTQFLLPRTSYTALLKESAELMANYVNESRHRLRTTPIEDLETITFMVGSDRFDAFAATFGEIR